MPTSYVWKWHLQLSKYKKFTIHKSRWEYFKMILHKCMCYEKNSIRMKLLAIIKLIVCMFELFMLNFWYIADWKKVWFYNLGFAMFPLKILQSWSSMSHFPYYFPWTQYFATFQLISDKWWTFIRVFHDLFTKCKNGNIVNLCVCENVDRTHFQFWLSKVQNNWQ